MPGYAPSDFRFMDTALAHARRQLGRTAPNPSVGCVIVKDGRIVGTGATADNGRPHAEPQALDMAGAKARGAEVFVTLEPCSFIGRSPACTSALIDAGVSRVTAACLDSDPRNSGRGMALLEAAGIRTRHGLLEPAALHLYLPYFERLKTGLPTVTIDDRDARFDARLRASDPEAAADELLQLGGAGMNTVNIHPDSPLAGHVDAIRQMLANRTSGITPR